MDLKTTNFSKLCSHIIFVCSFLGSLAGMLCTFFFVGHGQIPAVASFLAVIILKIAFIKSENYDLYNTLSTVSLGFLQFPVLWFSVGGINTAFMYYLFCIPLIYGVLLTKWQSVFIPLSNLILDDVMIYLSMKTQDLPRVDGDGNYIIAFSITYLIIFGAGFFASLNQKKVQSNLTSLYLHDELTGLKNRYAYHEDIRKFSPIVFASFDIDDFKKVNDTYLHIEGDKVLKAFANILKSVECDEVRCYRFGGEEFLLTSRLDIYTTNSIINNHIIDEVRKQLRDPDGHTITVSCGVAFSEEKNVDLKKLSDSYLYAAKFSGKNKVIFNGAEIH